jgi:hypothetical protein
LTADPYPFQTKAKSAHETHQFSPRTDHPQPHPT